jgi:hypothetical protein
MFDGAADALEAVTQQYRLDRTRGQPVSLYLGNEKAGQVAQLTAWFGDLGIPILPLGGWASQTFAKEVRQHAVSQRRPAILLYACDLDASGIKIGTDFANRSGCWDTVVRVALNLDRVEQYALPENPGKPQDPNAADFIAQYGRLFQVELDALDPSDLRDLYQAQIDRWWDDDAYQTVLAEEAEHRATLEGLRRHLPSEA